MHVDASEEHGVEKGKHVEASEFEDVAQEVDEEGEEASEPGEEENSADETAEQADSNEGEPQVQERGAIASGIGVPHCGAAGSRRGVALRSCQIVRIRDAIPRMVEHAFSNIPPPPSHLFDHR